MSTLIPKTGRRSFKARFAYFVMYTLLIAGGITMVVPFLMMLSISMKGKIDSENKVTQLVPRYFYDKEMLLKRYMEEETNYDVAVYNDLARDGIAVLYDAKFPAPANNKACDDYYEYLTTLPDTFTMMVNRGPIVTSGLNPSRYGLHPTVQDYRTAMIKKYHTMDAIIDKHGVVMPDRESLLPATETWYLRTLQPEFDLRLKDTFEFKKTQFAKHRVVPVGAEGRWNAMLRASYVKDVAKLNKDLGTNYKAVDSAPLSLRLPKGSPELVAKWSDFVHNIMPIWYVRADESARPAWIQFLRERYVNDIANYNSAHPGAKLTRFEDIPLPPPDKTGMDCLIARDYIESDENIQQKSSSVGEWADFLSKDVPDSAIYLDTPEQRYREMLKEKYKTVEAINTAYETKYANWSDIYPPTIPVKVAECEQNIAAVRFEFIVRNYRAVFSFLALHGRAFINTVILIVMALFFTLTINPITAYSLSRFKLSSTNKILLFMLATMAFPAEISLIPNFLILKELHLLNTYWALVLPGMASGFNIFLLKGMFDSLPQDLYEAAMLDGAGEGTIFWKVTMPLVKPFLAYLALGTFVAYYSTYVFALLYCPNPDMWTIMVYLQQMNDWAGIPVMFAAYTMASIPTLIVFVTCQRIIMQGIVLPTEK